MQTLWKLAVAEMRSCRRLARTWVFIFAAIFFCTGWYIGMTSLSMSPDPPSGWVNDQMSPRYTVSTMMNAFIAIFSVGVIFLTFDIRARDVQNRMNDVVDSLQASNVEIVLGRLTGILLLLLTPCLLFLASIACYELITNLNGFRFRIGIDPLSVASLVVWNLIPNLMFYGALVACLSMLMRVRALVAVIALGVLMGFLWIENQIPLQYQASLAQFLGSTMFPTDLAPVFITPAIFGNKLAMLLISICLLLFAAILFPRVDQSRKINAIAGCTAGSLAALTLFVLIYAVQNTKDLKEEWVTAHQELALSAYPDVQHLVGVVDLRPGRSISLDVSLIVQTPEVNNTDSIVFTLNPGYTMKELFVDQEATTEFSFKKGILKVSAHLFPHDTHDVRIVAKGKIDQRFAYLDQSRDFQTITHHSVPRLGLQSSIFHSDFVALMPGSFWYPMSGSATGRDILEDRPKDVFTTNLLVSVPNKWLVATVGKREIDSNQKRNTFRFQSAVPLPELALIASKFEQRKTNIEGVDFEVLLSKKHHQNLDILEPITEQIVQWVSDRLNTARSLSLEYPYGSFYVVEVPSNLRSYGGGWRMDTVLQPPGMMLVRETGFPTARFDTEFSRSHPWISESDDEKLVRIFNKLLDYFGNDQQGGNPFVGFSRNFVSHQLSVASRGATTLQYLLDELSNQLITGIESGSIISTVNFGTQVRDFRIGQTPDSLKKNWATGNRIAISTLPTTWDVLNQSSLFDLDFNEDPMPSYRALVTKGFPLAETMIMRFGAESMGRFLQQLLLNSDGNKITLDDFLETASRLGLDFDDWVLPWLEQTELPGFLVVNTSVSKINKPELGAAEYQTTFVLHNAENMPGFFRVVWTFDDEDQRLYTWGWGDYFNSDPIFLSGHQSKRIAIQSADPLTGIWVEPFLSLNRAPIEVQIPKIDEHNLQENPPLPFVTDVEWEFPDSDLIIVDDLDTGFSIVSADNTDKDTRQITYFERELDNGIPALGPNLGTWRREYRTESFGHYRNSHASIALGDGSTAARFRANLPQTGDWKLEIFLPPLFFNTYVSVTGAIVHDKGETLQKALKANSDSSPFIYNLEIDDRKIKHTAGLNIATAHEGWNEVGKFELRATEVEVLLSDKTGRDLIAVYADAIRWSPAATD